VLASAALAAVALCGCAAGGEELRGEVDSLRSEVRTLQREAAETSRKMDALTQRVDLALARAEGPAARASAPAGVSAALPPTGAPAASASSAEGPTPASTAATSQGVAARAAGPLVPPDLKVVRLAPPAPAKGPTPPRGSAPAKGLASSKGAVAAPLPRRSPPPVPTDTPIRDPDAGALAALGTGGRDLGAEARAALQAARAQSGLARARALEQFTAGYSGHPSADDALVEAARVREQAGDPDGACEVLGRAVAEYPVGDAVPEALAGLAACESRRGRASEARRLEARLLQDFPDSPAARSTRARTDAAQGAAP
jgi:TolA-binding protein